jgi:hypothetical protein
MGRTLAGSRYTGTVRGLGLLMLTACGRLGFDAPEDPTLLAHLALDDTPFSGGADDASGHGRAATCGACPTATRGWIGGGAAFTSADGHYLRLEWDPALNTTNAFTAAAWIRVTTANDKAMYVTKPYGDDLGNSWALWQPFGQLALVVDGIVRGGGPIDDIVFDREDVLIGVDDDYNALLNYADATIDDVRIYDRALSTAEIETLAQP